MLSNEQLFLNSSSDARLLAILDAAEQPIDLDPEALACDRDEFDMTPLFDGKALERI